MSRRIRNDDASEKQRVVPELPLPLPFPPDVDPDERDTCRDEKVSLLEGFRIELHSSDETTAALDRFPPDVFVLLCCHLTVQEIASLARCSKALCVASSNQDLWRLKFLARWNYEDPTIVDWSRAYQQAYFNPHDLWLTHWNCVEPCDGLVPGRCCVEEQQPVPQNHNTEKNTIPTNRKRRCPNCRYHPCIISDTRRSEEAKETTTIGESSISTVAQAIEAATNLRLEESSGILPYRLYSPDVAKRAFTTAATLHRSIDHRQYHSQSLLFLNDLLFFHLHDDSQEHTDDNAEPLEMKDWKDYMKQRTNSPRSNVTIDCDTLEPALHSWHLATVCNPDYNRPIVWRVSVQRSECFTVFPSEGYLLPGESKVITFGVKPFGSLLAYATQQVNVHREGADEFWAALYEEESHLPRTPFLFHYQYASTLPCQRIDTANRSLFQQHQQQQHRMRPPRQTNLQSRNDSRRSHPSNGRGSPWEESSFDQVQSIRTFVVAGHVHANYSLSTFRRRTLVPWQLQRHVPSATETFLKRYLPQKQQRTYSVSPVVFCSPQLMEFYPERWQLLQAIKLEDQRNQSVRASRYRTEGPCGRCGRTWGPRMEELGQAFVLAKLEGEVKDRCQRDEFERVHRIVKCLVQRQQHQRYNSAATTSNVWSLRNQRIVNSLHKKISNYRGSPWVSHKQAQVLLQWEILLDIMSRNASNKSEVEESRRYGVYRYPTCTDAVFNKISHFDRDSSELLMDPEMILWKDEPRQLETLSHLTNSPGMMRFNHQNQGHAEVGQFWESNDIFMDNHLCGLKAAISVLADPRSLVGHGLFDKVPYPGLTFRRCRLPILSTLDEERCSGKIQHQYQSLVRSFISFPTQLTYYKLQESLDIQSLLIVNSLFTRDCSLQASPHSNSLLNFINNIPPPGNGRFAISTAKSEINDHCGVLGMTELWFLDKGHSKVTELAFEENIHGLHNFTFDTQESEIEQQGSSHRTIPPTHNVMAMQQAAGFNNAMFPGRGPRILELLWMISSQLGWTVDDNKGANAVSVDRRILIATHWLSITLTFLPLIVTSFARYLKWIPAIPTSYHLEGLPHHVENKMRYLSEMECLCSTFVLLVLYCVSGRWIERYTGRQFFRAVKEHIPDGREHHLLRKAFMKVSMWVEREWDKFCPLVLQRLIYLPRWNRRDDAALLKYVCSLRSMECGERRSTFEAVAGRGGKIPETTDNVLNLDDEGTMKKILTGSTMVLIGFSVSCPHFFLNFLSVYCCSISLGVNVSLQSMEIGRSSVASKSVRPLVRSFSIATIAIFGLLVGQLVGSSGGVLFLAEFVVTCISLLLGGMGTISASGMGCWSTFFCLAITSFWGYLFGRCSVVENMHKKKVGISSLVVCISLYFALSLLILSFAGFNWGSVVDVVVKRPIGHEDALVRSGSETFEPIQLP